MCGFFAYALAHETAGAARTRSSLRPLLFRARMKFAKLGRSVSRECEHVRVLLHPPLEGEGRLILSAAKCETGWGGVNPSEAPATLSAAPPPHPAATGRRCASPGCVDPPPPGEGKSVSDGIENSRRTGYSAFAEYDGGGRSERRKYPTMPADAAWCWAAALLRPRSRPAGRHREHAAAFRSRRGRRYGPGADWWCSDGSGC